MSEDAKILAVLRGGGSHDGLPPFPVDDDLPHLWFKNAASGKIEAHYRRTDRTEVISGATAVVFEYDAEGVEDE